MQLNTLLSGNVSVAVGDIIPFTVIRDGGYAYWGTFEGQTGFMHCVELSRTKPIPPECHPRVGDVLKVQVFRLVTESQAELPADVTHGGEMEVHFAASVALLEPPPA